MAELLTNLLFEPKGKHNPQVAYNIKDTVMSADGSQVYFALKAVPVGIQLNNTEYWKLQIDLSETKSDMDAATNAANAAAANVTENIDRLSDEIGNFREDVSLKETNNFYISNEGKALVHDIGSYVSSKPIALTSGSKICFKAKGLSTYVSMIALYEHGVYKPLVVSDGSEVKDYMYVAESDCNIVLSFDRAKEHRAYIALLPNEKIGKTTLKQIDTAAYDVGFIDIYGSAAVSGNWKHTKPFFVAKDDVIDFYGYHYANVPVLLKCVDGVYFPLVISKESAMKTTTYTAPEDGYYVANFTSTYDVALRTKNSIANCVNNYNGVEEGLQIPYMSIFHKIGGIGDSLMTGATHNGSSTVDNPKYSWLANIARNIGVDYRLYSQGGMTAKAWVNDTGGLKTELGNEAEKCSLYYIALGTNDKNQTVYPIGALADNAGTDTFVGHYKSIIEYVHEKAPNALIICVSTYNNSEVSSPYNAMIEEITNQYSYCHFLDYATNSPIWTTQTNLFVADSHFTTTGYVFVANIIKKLTEAIVKGNIGDFSQLGLKYPNI